MSIDRDRMYSTPLTEARLEDLIFELKRRSVGCVLAVMTVDESGDHWRLASKGSPEMVESLLTKCEDDFLPPEDEEETVSPP